LQQIKRQLPDDKKKNRYSKDDLEHNFERIFRKAKAIFEGRPS